VESAYLLELLFYPGYSIDQSKYDSTADASAVSQTSHDCVYVNMAISQRVSEQDE